MASPKLVSFSSLAGVPCYYARINPAYGNTRRCTKSRKRRLNPTFLKKLDACMQELWWLTFGTFGNLEAIVSGGAYVKKAGEHGKGKAYDLGGLHWEHNQLVNYRLAEAYHGSEGAAASGYMLYMGVESVLRRSFGTVLGMHYNSDHNNHYHFDTKTKVGYWDRGFGSTTRTTYMRENLRHVWGLDIGNALKDLRDGVREIRAKLSLDSFSKPEAWQQFLLLSAMASFQKVA